MVTCGVRSQVGVLLSVPGPAFFLQPAALLSAGLELGLSQLQPPVLSCTAQACLPVLFSCFVLSVKRPDDSVEACFQVFHLDTFAAVGILYKSHLQ